MTPVAHAGNLESTEAGPPSLEQFLTAPIEEVRRVAPAGLFWVVEGTRRSAALAGIAPEEYPRWSLQRMCDCLEIFFHHGVRHVYNPMLTPSQFMEVTPGYRERLFDWVALMADDPEVLGRFRQHGWKVRLVGGESLPELQPIAQRLAAATPQGEHTVWCSVVAESGAVWTEILSAIAASGARTREEAIRAVYGEDLPLATVLLAFGKPVFSTDQLSPLLVGKMDCYWTQQPGYRMTEQDFRTILYDAAFIRHTWRKDKTGRPKEALGARQAWEQGPILGLGVRLGPFWYPAP